MRDQSISRQNWYVEGLLPATTVLALIRNTSDGSTATKIDAFSLTLGLFQNNKI